MSTSYNKNPDAVYTSRAFTFGNLPKPINSSLITLYLKNYETIEGINALHCILRITSFDN